MKKILSILICLVLGISSAWAAQYTHTINVYARNSNVSTQGGGIVTARGGYYGDLDQQWNWNDATVSSSEVNFNTSTTTEEQSYSIIVTTVKNKSKIQLTATPLAGYYFSHWTGNGQNSTTVLDWSATTGNKEISWQGKSKTFYYYAIFKPVTVNSVSADYTTIQTVDVNGSMTANVTFGVTGADNMNDFLSDNVTYTTTDSRFTVGTAVVNSSAGTVTIPVTYTDDNHHIMDGTLPQITLSLTSKGNVSSTKSITIYAKSNLYPEFTATPSPCDLTPDNPVDDGQTVSATITTSYSKIATGNANNVWTAEFVNPAEAASLGYSLDETDPKNPKVSFTPTAQSINKVNVETALRIRCIYTDATPQEVSHEQIVILSADAGKVFSINALKDAVMDFDIIDYSETNNPVTLEYPIFTTLLASDFNVTENLNGVNYTTTIDGHASPTDKIVVTAQSNLVPNTYTSTIEYDEIGGDLEASLTVNVPIKLAKPVVNAIVGLGQKILLDWQDVYGATSYIVKSGETILATIIPETGVLESAYAVTNVAGKSMVIGSPYSFTVTAVYEPNTFGNRVSEVVTVTPTALSTITSTTELDIWTGTDIFKAGDATYGVRPYHQKRKIDLSAAFDESDNPLFDQLYIFGLTTNSDATTVTVDGVTSHKITGFTQTTNSNAVTPCYVYNKSGNKYVLDASKSVANVNVSTKPASFNIEAKGQKVYFTGYAPYASCGSTWEENGVFCFTGDGQDIDIYLDNLQLFARYKSETGNVAKTKSYEIKTVGDLNQIDSPEFQIDYSGPSVNVYAQGSGSAFCFHPKSNFSPKIHLNGENSLESVEGMYIYMDIDFLLQFKTDIPVVQKSAPIQILHNNETSSKTTKLIIDDLWNSQRTNGSLDLASIGSIRNAPTIDLGNEKTELSFEGGKIQLANSYNESTTYTVSYAISYRKYSMKDGMANMYGLGNDQPEGKVRFKDGTISCKPLSDELFQKPIGQALYHNTTSMKCPWDTKIDGGTFNSDVLVCATTTSKGTSPQNSNGDALCKYAIPVKSVSASGVATELVEDWKNYAVSIGAKTNDLGYYGISSMTPKDVTDEEGNPLKEVYLMLPSTQVCFVDLQTTPWVMCYPEMSITVSMPMGLKETIDLGGVVTVPDSRSVDDEGLTTIKKTSKFLYGELDPLYMIPNISSYDAPGEMTLALKEGGVPETVNNVTDYVVYDKLYMLIPVVANQWKMFVPPFDVSNVYVIESYPENKLIADFGTETTDKKGNIVKEITEESQIEQARIVQSYRLLDLFYHLVWSADVSKSTADFWSNTKGYPAIGNFNSYGTFVQDWMNMYIERDGAGNITNKDYMPVIEQLYHYTSDPSAVYPTGNWWDANFYLYKAANNVLACEDDQLQMDWEEVPVVSKARNLAGNHNVIMEKGGVYVWSFPSTVVNNTMQDYTKNWDYWTGKYILIEGYPTEEFDTDGDRENDDMGQLIAGSDAINSTILADVDPNNMAEMRGNYTFAKANLDDVQNPFVLNNYYRGTSMDTDAAETSGWYGLIDDQSPHNEYVNADGYGVELTAGQGFILTNFTSSYGLRPRSINVKSGAVTYYDRDETTTSVPTIGGNNQMFVYNIAGGVGIVPVVEQQVSIYNAAGQLITSEYLTDEVHISLPTGIYLIAGAQDQFKVVVK